MVSIWVAGLVGGVGWVVGLFVFAWVVFAVICVVVRVGGVRVSRVRDCGGVSRVCGCGVFVCVAGVSGVSVRVRGRDCRRIRQNRCEKKKI